MEYPSIPVATNLPQSEAPVSLDGLDICYRLRRAGIKQSDIARELKVSPAAVGNVIHGRKTAFAIAAHVAGLLGTQPEKLWPHRYRFQPRGPSPRRTNPPSIAMPPSQEDQSAPVGSQSLPSGAERPND